MFTTDFMTGLFVGGFFGIQMGAIATALAIVFADEIGALVNLLRKTVARIRAALAIRRERRRSLNAARRRALLIAVGGTVTVPRKG